MLYVVELTLKAHKTQKPKVNALGFHYLGLALLLCVQQPAENDVPECGQGKQQEHY